MKKYLFLGLVAVGMIFSANVAWARTPNNIQATDGKHIDGVWVTWTGGESTANQWFYIYRSTSPSVNCSGSYIGAKLETNADGGNFWDGPNHPNPALTHPGALPSVSTKYYYAVKWGSEGCSTEYSSIDSGFVAPPKEPASVDATDSTTASALLDKVKVTWTEPATGLSNTAYELWRSSVGAGAPANYINGTNGLTLDDTTAVPGTTYLYWVKSKSILADGTGSYSAGYRTDEGSRKITPVTNIVPTTDRTDGIRVTWNSTLGAVSYDVWRCTGSTIGTCAVIGGSNTTNLFYLDNSASLVTGTNYWYAIQAWGTHTGSDKAISATAGKKAAGVVPATLNINSTGSSGVAISATGGVTSNNTDYWYQSNAAINTVLTAPATAGGNNYNTWTGCDSKNDTNRTCTVAVALGVTKTVTVDYLAPGVATLNVDSYLDGVKAAGVVIAGTNSKGGTTNYTKTAASDISSVLTAPATYTGLNFDHWSGCDATNATNRTCDVAIAVGASQTARVYYVTPPAAGTFKISGSITPPVPGATMAITGAGAGSGSLSCSVVADGSSYSCLNIPGTVIVNFIIPAVPANYTISPENHEISSALTADLVRNFTSTYTPPATSACDTTTDTGGTWKAPSPGTVAPASNASTTLNIGAKSQIKAGCLTIGRATQPTALFPLYVEGDAFINGTLNTRSLTVGGDIAYSGTLTNISDRRLKTNIIPLGETLSRVLKLRPITFKWKDVGRGTKTQIGLIAQEVEPLFPEVVKTGTDGYKSLDYTALVSPLIKATQEQQTQIDELKQELQALKSSK